MAYSLILLKLSKSTSLLWSGEGKPLNLINCSLSSGCELFLESRLNISFLNVKFFKWKFCYLYNFYSLLETSYDTLTRKEWRGSFVEFDYLFLLFLLSLYDIFLSSCLCWFTLFFHGRTLFPHSMTRCSLGVTCWVISQLFRFKTDA